MPLEVSAGVEEVLDGERNKVALILIMFDSRLIAN